MKNRFLRAQGGFTLLEILLVVAAIGILAGIVILAINPTKQLGDTRDSQRKTDVTTILDAIYQYSLDNNGNLPTVITTTVTPICVTNPPTDCTGLIDLSVLTTNEEYLVTMPIDPGRDLSDDQDSALYTVVKTANNRVTVAAPDAENGAISATR